MQEGFDTEGRRLPIKIDTTSNGEFLPRPLNRLARAANREAHRYVGDCALRLGLSRRTFLKSVCGAAATLLCLNQVFARAGRGGGSFALPPVAAFEPAAAEAVLSDSDFIFDIQAHHVNPRGAWRRLTNRWTYILRSFRRHAAATDGSFLHWLSIPKGLREHDSRIEKCTVFFRDSL